MAQGIRLVCDICDHAIEGWSDGNPYFLDAAGEKHYAYHPDHANLDRCVGNDVPHLCLGCGREQTVDSRAPNSTCSGCNQDRMVKTFNLESEPCPFCRRGRFRSDPDYFAIS